MTSFYGSSSASFYGNASAMQWYSAVDLGSFGVIQETDATSAGDAIVDPTVLESTSQLAGYSSASTTNVDATPTGATSTRTFAGKGDSESRDGHPSFYGRGPNGLPGKFMAKTRPQAYPTGSSANHNSVDKTNKIVEEAVAATMLAGDSVSVAPRRPGGRSVASRALDKDLADCTRVEDVFAVAEKSASDMDAANWANLIYNIAHFKKHSRSVEEVSLSSNGGSNPSKSPSASWLRNHRGWTWSCKQFLPHLPALTARDTANVLWSLATLDLRSEPIFDDTADALRGKLAVCDPVSVSKAAWALTAVPGRDRRLALFTHLAVPVVLRAEVFPLGALTMTCYAFAKAAHMDPEVYSAISGAIERFPSEELRPVDVCNVIWAFCTVGYRDDNLFSRICDDHLSKRDVVINFNPQDLSNTTWGFSKVLYVHESAMDTLAWGGLQQREHFKAIHFSNFFYSFAMLRLRGPDGFLATMADLAVNKLSGFDSGNLTIAVWAFAQLRERHALVDEAVRSVQRPGVCASLLSRTLSMLFLAYFRLGRIEDVDAIFDASIACGKAIGASGFSAAIMTGEQGKDPARLARILQAMANEADDDRMRTAIGNAAAILLSKRNRMDEARQMLYDLRTSGCWSAVSIHLLERLEGAAGMSASSVENAKEIWQRPVRSGIHPIAATRQNEGPHAYTREFMTLQAVLCGAPAGDVDACMAAVEQFAESRSLWLKITAWEKAVVVHEVARLSRAKVAVEIGAYVGYSAMNIARAIRPHGGRVASIEVDPVHVTIVRNMVEYAGLSDNVDVWSGYCYDVIPHLLETYGKHSVGMVFMDQKGTRFHTDLALMEELELLSDGAVILADNVLKPGAPLYIWHLMHGPYAHCTAISVREFLLQSEDWMVMGFRDPSRGPVATPPPQLHRVAFESDAFRKRSMFDSVSPSKSDWWAFSQRFVDGLERCGTKPKVVGLHGRDNPVIQPADIETIFSEAGRLPSP